MSNRTFSSHFYFSFPSLSYSFQIKQRSHLALPSSSSIINIPIFVSSQSPRHPYTVHSFLSFLFPLVLSSFQFVADKLNPQHWALLPFFYLVLSSLSLSLGMHCHCLPISYLPQSATLSPPLLFTPAASCSFYLSLVCLFISIV